jgi:hypothetical protein
MLQWVSYLEDSFASFRENAQWVMTFEIGLPMPNLEKIHN